MKAQKTGTTVAPGHDHRPTGETVRHGMRRLVAELGELEERLRNGGGAEKIERQHQQGKLTARERVQELVDPGSRFFEIGLLVAHDLYDGAAPAAGVVTGLGYVADREVAIVANDATVKAGAWW